MVDIVGYDESVKKRVTCRKCSAILQYVPKEVKSHKSYDYGGGCDINYYVTCPACSEKVYVR
jgi:RNase P subunit RPR2